MTEYQKIPGPFVRDPQTNKILVDEWTSPELAALWGLPIWNLTEKVDGTNVRVYWDGHRVSYKGRSETAQFSDFQLEGLDRRFGGEDNETKFEQKFGAKHAVLYGELYGPKIQKGGNYRADIDFILFDVNVEFESESLDLLRSNVEDVAAALGIDVVPLVAENVTLEVGLKLVTQGYKSTIARTPIFAEGLVATNALGLRNRRGDRLIVKLKHRDLYVKLDEI